MKAVDGGQSPSDEEYEGAAAKIMMRWLVGGGGLGGCGGNH